MADPVGTDPPRCYVSVNNDPVGPQWANYIPLCAAMNGTLASFRSASEFTAIGQACGDWQAAGYYAPGCWLDGVTNDGYNPWSPSKTLWHWSTSGDSTDFLVSSYTVNNLWSGGEPSGKWNGHDELCMQVFTNGNLNDYPCYGGLGAICMMDSVAGTPP
jgi:hypothetical protein